MQTPEPLDAAWHAFDPMAPLSFKSEVERAWFVDLDKVRGPTAIVERIVRALLRSAPNDRPAPDPWRALLMGHAGCGKSTALRRIAYRLTTEAQAAPLVVLVQADEALDRQDIDITEVLLLCVHRTVTELQDANHAVPEPELEAIRGFFKTVLHTDTIETKASGQVDTPAFFQRLIGTLRVSATTRTEVRETMRRRTGELLTSLRTFFDAAQHNVFQAGHRGLTLLIDGIEKVSQSDEQLQRVRGVLLDGAEKLRSIGVPMVLSAPIQLAAGDVRLENTYANTFLFPSIIVGPRIDQPDKPSARTIEKGRAALREVLTKRTTLDALFADDTPIDVLISACGGNVRDLFRMVRNAIDAAQDDGASRITDQHAKRAVREEQATHALRLQPGERERMATLLDDATVFDRDALGATLLTKELVLYYRNGGDWYGIHPAVLDKVRAYRSKAQASEGT